MISDITIKNETTNSTDSSAEVEHAEIIKVIQVFFYSLIMAVGAVGNMLICMAVLGRKRRKISEYFILNLAITDLATSIISIPLDIIERISGSWPFGGFLCKVVYPMQTVIMAVSVATLLAMSLERYRAILHPLKPRIKGTMPLVVISVIWTGSIALVLPYISVLSYDGENCSENWPSVEYYVKAYTMSVFVVLYLLPLLVISFAYARVGYKLYSDIKQVKNILIGGGDESAKGRESFKYRAHRNVRIVKIFTSAVGAFAVCFLPTHVMWIWHDYGTGSESPYFSILLAFASILVYANSCINPFIFGTLQKRCGSTTQKGQPKNKNNMFFYSLRMSFTSSSSRFRRSCSYRENASRMDAIRRKSPNGEETAQV